MPKEWEEETPIKDTIAWVLDLDEGLLHLLKHGPRTMDRRRRCPLRVPELVPTRVIRKEKEEDDRSGKE